MGTKQINNFQASVDATQVLVTVEDTLKRCKSIDYRNRPEVSEIVAEFEKVLETLEVNFVARKVINNMDHVLDTEDEDSKPKDYLSWKSAIVQKILSGPEASSQL